MLLHLGDVDLSLHILLGVSDLLEAHLSVSLQLVELILGVNGELGQLLDQVLLKVGRQRFKSLLDDFLDACDLAFPHSGIAFILILGLNDDKDLDLIASGEAWEEPFGHLH